MLVVHRDRPIALHMTRASAWVACDARIGTRRLISVECLSPASSHVPLLCLFPSLDTPETHILPGGAEEDSAAQQRTAARSSAPWLCRELAIAEDTSSTGARWSCLHHGGACSRGGMYRNLRLACTIIDAGSGRSLHFRMESFCVFHTHVCMFAQI